MFEPVLQDRRFCRQTNHSPQFPQPANIPCSQHRAATGDDDRGTPWIELFQRGCLFIPKPLLPKLLKDVGDRPAKALFNDCVGIQNRPAEQLSEAVRDR